MADDVDYFPAWRPSTSLASATAAFEDNVKATHLAARAGHQALQAATKPLAPIDFPERFAVLDDRARLRQHRQQRRIPFRLRGPAAGIRPDRPRPRAAE